MATTRDLTIRVSVIEGDKTKKELVLVGEEGQRALEKIREATKPANDNLKLLNSTVEEAKGKFEQFAEHGGVIGRILSEIGPAGLIAAAGVGAMVYAIHSSVEEAEKFEQAQRRLQAILTATDGSVGLSKKELTEYSEEVAHTSLATSENVQQIEAVLLTFKNVHGDTFKQAVRLTTDLSDVFQKDFTAAARALGQALDDPVNGLGALGKAGVKLRVEQKEEIKQLAQLGDQELAQAKIIDILTEKFGGAAGAQDAGVTGASKHFKESLDELSRAVGQNIQDSSLLETILTKLTSTMRSLREEVRPTAEEELKELNARMQLMQGAGTNTLLFGAVDNPFYDQLQARKAKLEEEIAKDEADKQTARQKGEEQKAREHGEELLHIQQEIDKKIKEETQTEEDKIIEQTAAFKQRIQAQLLNDGSNKGDVEKELALADKLQKLQLDRVNEKEAEAAKKLAEANQKIVDTLEKRVKLEALTDPKQQAIQGEVDKLNPSASNAQIERTKQLAAALYDEKKAAQEAKDAETAHDRALQTINQELLKTKPSFEAAKQALDEWKKKLIDDLGGATAENQKYLAEIDQIYSVKLKEIYRKSLQDSKDWEAGAARGLAEYAQDAQNAAKDAQSMVTTIAHGVEDTLVDIASTGKINLQKIGDMVKSLEQDILRSFIRQNITGPIAGQLSGLLGGGAEAAAGGASGGGIFGSLFSSIFHEGGVVGETSAQRSVPAWMFAGAPRFHTGLAPDEFPAILQRGETVIPKNGKASGTNIIMNINTPNVQSFMESQGQVMAKLATQMNRYHARNN